MSGYSPTTFIALCVLGLAVGCTGPTTSHGVGDTPTSTGDAQMTGGSPLAKPVNAKLSAADLCKAYVKDEGAADENFKGKIIEVTGVVVMPRQSGSNNDVYFTVSGAGDDSRGSAPFLRCFLAADDLTQNKGLAQGQKVTFHGFCEGRSVGTQQTLLDLKRCVITKVEPK